MRKASSFISLLGATVLITVFSLLFNYLSFPAIGRVWEFPIDLKVVAIAFVAWYAIRRDSGGYLRGLGLRSWNWLYVFSAFCAPAVLVLATVAIGYILKAVEFQGVENAPTLFLAVVFDLPALFFFSATTILVEEIVFRGLFFEILSERGNLISASLLTSTLWAVLRIADAFAGSTHLPLSIASQLVNLLSFGVVLNLLFIKSSSVWVPYAFRLGVATFSSIFLGGAEAETNSLFVAKCPHVETTVQAMALLYAALAFLLAKCSDFGHRRQEN